MILDRFSPRADCIICTSQPRQPPLFLSPFLFLCPLNKSPYLNTTRFTGQRTQMLTNAVKNTCSAFLLSCFSEKALPTASLLGKRHSDKTAWTLAISAGLGLAAPLPPRPRPPRPAPPPAAARSKPPPPPDDRFAGAWGLSPPLWAGGDDER